MDRVQAIKWESPAHGGTQTDQTPTELDVHEDHLECRGVVIQDDTSDDEDVGVTRDASGNLMFRDKVVSGEKSLADVMSGGTAFDPGKLLITTEGGLLYNSQGILLVKASA